MVGGGWSGAVGKNVPANEGDAGDSSLIPGLGEISSRK